MAAKIFKPRRGKVSTMAGTKSNTVLALGEFFIEVPDAGSGTGTSKIKIGDGATTYSNLPYAIGDIENYSQIPISSISGTSASTILSNNVVDGRPLKTLLSGLKSAILAQASQISSLESSISNFNSAKSTIVSSSLGSALGFTTSSTISTIASSLSNVTVRSSSGSTLSAGSSRTVSAGYYASSFTVSASSLASQTSGTATAARIRSGYTAWVDGVKLTGTYTATSSTTYVNPSVRIYNYIYTWNNTTTSTQISNPRGATSCYVTVSQNKGAGYIKVDGTSITSSGTVYVSGTVSVDMMWTGTGWKDVTVQLN